MPRDFVLLVGCHGQLYAVLARLILQCDGSLGRVGPVRGWIFLCDGFEHGNAKLVHEPHLLRGGQLSSNHVSRVWILRLESYGQLHIVLCGFVLQADGSERRLGSVQRRVLLRRWLVDCHAAFVH